MLGLPSMTGQDTAIPKEIIYSHARISTAVRREFIDGIASIRLANVVNPNTASVADGEHVHEIDVFLIRLKTSQIPEQALTILASAIKHDDIFVCSFESDNAVIICRNGLHMTRDILQLDLSPADLDCIWDKFCSNLIFGKTIPGDVDDALNDSLVEKGLRKQLGKINSKLCSECQIRRRNALFEQRKDLLHRIDAVKKDFERNTDGNADSQD